MASLDFCPSVFKIVQRTLIVIPTSFVILIVHTFQIHVRFCCRLILFAIVLDSPHHGEVLSSIIVSIFLVFLRFYLKLIVKLSLSFQLLLLNFLFLHSLSLLHLFHLPLQFISISFHFVLFHSLYRRVFIVEEPFQVPRMRFLLDQPT